MVCKHKQISRNNNNNKNKNKEEEKKKRTNNNNNKKKTKRRKYTFMLRNIPLPLCHLVLLFLHSCKLHGEAGLSLSFSYIFLCWSYITRLGSSCKWSYLILYTQVARSYDAFARSFVVLSVYTNIKHRSTFVIIFMHFPTARLISYLVIIIIIHLFFSGLWLLYYTSYD